VTCNLIIDGVRGIKASFPGKTLVLMDTEVVDNFSEFEAHIMMLGKKHYLHTFFKGIESLENANEAHCDSQNKIDQIISDFNLQRNLNVVKVEKTMMTATMRRKRLLPAGGSLEGWGADKRQKDICFFKCLLTPTSSYEGFNFRNITKSLFSFGLFVCLFVCLFL